MSEPRSISLITLGVRDLELSLGFYGALGFADTPASQEKVKFLEAGNTVLGLYGRAALADDAEVQDEPTGFSAVTLALNMESEDAVSAFFARALLAGGRAVKQPQKVFWGGYSGYFADPDGHLWEVAHNPFFPIDETGRIDFSRENRT